MEPNRSSLSRENSGIPSNNLSGLLEQLGTLNNRHEQLRALVEALEVRKQLSLHFFFFSSCVAISTSYFFFFFFQRQKLNRDEFDGLKNQQNDLLDRLAALERDFNDLQSKRRHVSETSTHVFR